MTIPTVIGQVYEARFQCLASNQVSQNTVHYKVTNLVDGQVSDQQLADALSDVAGPLYKDYLSVESQYLGLRLQKIAPNPKATYVISTVEAAIGEVAFPVLPTMACGGIVKLTDEAERRYRGFVFLPFFTENHNEEPGIPNAAAATAMGNWAAGLLTQQVFAIGGATITLIPVIHSKGQAGVDLVVDKEIIDWRIQDWWVTHKSRAQNRRGDILGP